MKIAFVGDIALFGRMSLDNNPFLLEYFRDVSGYLKKMDLVIGNLESPFSIAQKTHGAKSAYLFSSPKNIEVLKWLNISAVTLANNHMFDYGKEGYETTKLLLNENEIEYFGSEGKDFLYEGKGCRLVFSGYCCYSSGPRHCVPFGDYGVNEYNLRNAIIRLQEYSKNGFLNILCVHAGKEHVNYPGLDTIMAARIMAKEAPMLYIGHHPHVAQGIEKIDDSIIAYSLGNFCFDDVYSSVSDKPLIKLSENNRNSFILEVTIDANKIIDYSVVPVYIGEDKLLLGKGVTLEKIEEYTKPILQLSEAAYNEMRSSLLNAYLDDRKNMRNLSWFVKRIRPRYVRMLIDGQLNRNKYKKSLKKWLQ